MLLFLPLLPGPWAWPVGSAGFAWPWGARSLGPWVVGPSAGPARALGWLLPGRPVCWGLLGFVCVCWGCPSPLAFLVRFWYDGVVGLCALPVPLGFLVCVWGALWLLFLLFLRSSFVPPCRCAGRSSPVLPARSGLFFLALGALPAPPRCPPRCGGSASARVRACRGAVVRRARRGRSSCGFASAGVCCGCFRFASSLRFVRCAGAARVALCPGWRWLGRLCVFRRRAFRARRCALARAVCCRFSWRRAAGVGAVRCVVCARVAGFFGAALGSSWRVLVAGGVAWLIALSPPLVPSLAPPSAPARCARCWPARRCAPPRAACSFACSLPRFAPAGLRRAGPAGSACPSWCAGPGRAGPPRCRSAGGRRVRRWALAGAGRSWGACAACGARLRRRGCGVERRSGFVRGFALAPRRRLAAGGALGGGVRRRRRAACARRLLRGRRCAGALLLSAPVAVGVRRLRSRGGGGLLPVRRGLRRRRRRGRGVGGVVGGRGSVRAAARPARAALAGGAGGVLCRRVFRAGRRLAGGGWRGCCCGRRRFRRGCCGAGRAAWLPWLLVACLAALAGRAAGWLRRVALVAGRRPARAFLVPPPFFLSPPGRSPSGGFFCFWRGDPAGAGPGARASPGWGGRGDPAGGGSQRARPLVGAGVGTLRGAGPGACSLSFFAGGVGTLQGVQLRFPAAMGEAGALVVWGKKKGGGEIQETQGDRRQVKNRL